VINELDNVVRCPQQIPKIAVAGVLIAMPTAGLSVPAWRRPIPEVRQIRWLRTVHTQRSRRLRHPPMHQTRLRLCRSRPKHRSVTGGHMVRATVAATAAPAVAAAVVDIRVFLVSF